jgi:hypothetical protein
LIPSVKGWKADRRFLWAIVVLAVVIPGILSTVTMFHADYLPADDAPLIFFFQIESMGLPILVYLAYQKNLQTWFGRVLFFAFSVFTGWILAILAFLILTIAGFSLGYSLDLIMRTVS